MKKEIHYVPQKFATLKTVLAIIAAILMVIEIVFAVKTLLLMSPNYRKITTADFETLKSGELVSGILDKNDIIMSYDHVEQNMNPVYMAAVLSEHRKIMIFSAVADNQSDAYDQLKKLSSGEISSLLYKGQVEVLYNATLQAIQANMILQNAYHSHHLNNSDYIGLLIHTGSIENAYGIKVVVASFAGALLMAVLIVFLMKKTVHNIRYGILVRKGIIEPDLKVRKEDLVFENTSPYQGKDSDADTFYVNTNYDLHTSLYTPTGQTASSGESDALPDTSAAPDNGAAPPTETAGEEPPAAPMRYHEKIDFYESGLNEDGNFYVDKEETPMAENDPRRLRY